MSPPYTFRGTLPCEDCPGVTVILTVRDDGTYLTERLHLASDTRAERLLREMGGWTVRIPEQLLELHRPDGSVERWQALSADTFLQEGFVRRRRVPADSLPLLTRVAHRGSPTDGHLATGLYRRWGQGATLTVCPGIVRYPLLPGPAALELHRRTLEAGIPDDEPRRVRYRGWIDPDDHLVLESVDTVGEEEDCPSGGGS